MNMDRRTFVAGSAAVAGVAAIGGTASALAESLPADGTYTTSAEGRNGLVTMEVTFKDGAIADAKVVDHQETEVYTSGGIEEICAQMVAGNTFFVDSVSGCTGTRSAMMSCVMEAIEAAGGDPDAFGPADKPAPGPDMQIDADVAIVGAGMSGMFAAVRAAEAGARVAIIEKTRHLGGCSLTSFSTALYPAETVRDTMVNWVSNQMYLADPSVVYAYLSNDADAVGYAQEAGFFPYIGDPNALLPTMLAPYMERPGFYAEFAQKVLDAGGAVMTDVCANSLVKEGDAVTGVVCTAMDGAMVTVKAKAVVIATGGFGGDTEYLKELTGMDLVCGCLTQCRGEGMRMAWEAGAAVPPSLGGMMLHQTLALAKLRGYEFFQQQMPMILGYVPCVLDVTRAGVRFRNEDWVNTAVAAAGSGAFAGGVTYAMLDTAMVNNLMDGGTQAIGFTSSPGMPPAYKPQFDIDTPWDMFDVVLDDCVANGWAFKGDTVEDVAVAAGMAPEVLRATVDKYNEYCATGDDIYFGKAPEHLIALETGPFYLVGITYNQLGTVGGMIINDKFQVLDPANIAIPGLYSAGADAYGTCWNRNYYGQGDGIGFALTSGYLVGQIVADYALA